MRHTRLLASTFFVLAASTVFVACGGSDDPEEPGSTEGETTDAIGADGGSVTGAGAEVMVPAGALEADVEISVASVDVSDAELPEGFELAGDPIAFTPHGTSFEEAVTLTLPYDSDADSLTILRLDDEDDTTWEVVQGGSFDDGVATVEVNSFSIYGVAEALGGEMDMAIDVEAACTEICEWKLSIGCTAEMDQAGCEEDCVMDPVPDPDEPCFTEYVAFANCLGEEEAAAYECKDDDTAGLIDGVCEAELIGVVTCLQGG